MFRFQVSIYIHTEITIVNDNMQWDRSANFQQDNLSAAVGAPLSEMQKFWLVM